MIMQHVRHVTTSELHANSMLRCKQSHLRVHITSYRRRVFCPLLGKMTKAIKFRYASTQIQIAGPFHFKKVGAWHGALPRAAAFRSAPPDARGLTPDRGDSRRVAFYLVGPRSSKRYALLPFCDVACVLL